MKSKFDERSGSGRKAKFAAPRVNALPPQERLVSYTRANAVKHLINRGREIYHAGARNDDRIPPSVRFLGDPKEASAIVFTKLHVETLPFDLKLFRVDDAVHFPKNGAV